MQTYRPPPVDVRAGRGHRLWDGDGTALPRLPRRPRGHVARPRPPGGRRRASPSRPARCCTSRTCTTPTSQPRGGRARSTGCSAAAGQVFFCNSGAEANECAIKLARQYGRRAGRHVVVSAPTARFHGRTLATLAATGQPQKQEAFQPLPEGFRQVACDDLDALDGGARRPRWPRCCSSRCRARAACNPATAEYLAGRAPAVRRARACCSSSTRCRPASAAPARWFGFQHFGVRPDVVTMAKALGNGVPIGACWARAEVAAAFEPGDHATTFGGQPLAARRGARRARRDGGRGRARPGRRGPASGSPSGARRRSPASPRARARACCSPPSSTTASTPRRSRGAASTRAWSSTRSRRPRCGSPRRCSSPTTRSTRRSRSSTRCSGVSARRDAHFLEVDDLDRRRARARCSTCAEPTPTRRRSLRRARGAALLFEKPSARTRNSTEMAVVQLGGHPVTIRREEVGHRRAGDGRGRRPHARRLPRRHRRPRCSTTTRSSGWPAVATSRS